MKQHHQCKITPENIQDLKENEIFVFGSNLAGIHGGGAALLAKNKFGAKQGVGIGITGNCYALPTKDFNIQTLPINSEKGYCIKQFVEYLLLNCKNFINNHFLITEVGCGLAGYKPEQIAPLFSGFENLNNVSLPQTFIDIIYKSNVKTIRTYKMTDKNMKCRGFQYKLGIKYEMNQPISICNSGFHSCQTAQGCLSYYYNNGENRLFLCEIEVNGNEKFENGDNIEQFSKICSDNIIFIEELTNQSSVYFNSGDSNSGNWNSGDSNSGDSNSGYRNSGDRNSGDRNSGDSNSGDRNSGNRNSGDWNSGDRNSGDSNSGDRNSGNRNSGDWNSGYRNSGNRNSGDWNSGNWNSGNRNSGDSNSGYRNSGAFCIDQNPKLVLFDKPTDIDIKDWENSEVMKVMNNYLNFNFWVYESEMSAKEKKDNPTYTTTGGYLKQISVHEGWKNMWGNLTEHNKNLFKNLPNFDSKKFEIITGIKIK